MRNLVFALLSFIALKATALSGTFCQVDFEYKNQQQEQYLGINFQGQKDLEACVQSALKSTWPANVSEATVNFEDDKIITSTKIKRK